MSTYKPVPHIHDEFVTKVQDGEEIVNDIFDEEDADELQVFSTPKGGVTHNIYLGTSVLSSDKYYKLFNTLAAAGPDDDFRVHLNNYGGYVSGGTQLMNSLRSTKGHVKMIVAGPVYSMASLLAICVEDVEIHDHTFLMFHDYSGGSVGKGAEMIRSVISYKAYFEQVLKDVGKDFLTKKEITDLYHGVDLYVTAEDARKRLVARAKKRKTGAKK